jgi:lipoate-protein ligase A
MYPFPETAVVLGRGSKLDVELDIDPILDDETKIYRRRGGGCSVVLDPGNLIVSVAMPIEGLRDTKIWFDRCTNWMIDGLRLSGIKKVYHDGISDLVIERRKIAGSAFYRMKGYAYYTVALLVTPNIDLMEKYLKHPPREPDYRDQRSHKDFVVAISEYYPDIDVYGLINSLEKYLTIENLLMH